MQLHRQIDDQIPAAETLFQLFRQQLLKTLRDARLFPAGQLLHRNRIIDQLFIRISLMPLKSHEQEQPEIKAHPDHHQRLLDLHEPIKMMNIEAQKTAGRKRMALPVDFHRSLSGHDVVHFYSLVFMKHFFAFGLCDLCDLHLLLTADVIIRTVEPILIFSHRFDLLISIQPHDRFHVERPRSSILHRDRRNGQTSNACHIPVSCKKRQKTSAPR